MNHIIVLATRFANLAAFVFFFQESKLCAEMDYFDAFKENLSTPVIAITIDFEEGEVNEKAHTMVEKLTATDGKRIFVVKQSVRSFSASCQNNAFMLVQHPERVPLAVSANSTNYVTTSIGCGYFGNQAWSRSDAYLVQLLDLNATDAQTNRIFQKIREDEDKVWTIYYRGVPRLVSETIEWKEMHLTAKTLEGDNFVGDIYLDEKSGKIEKMTYTLSGNAMESVNVLYSYRSHVTSDLLPDSFNKQVLSASDPYVASRHSFEAEIIQVQSFPALFAANHYTAPIFESSVAISNGVAMSRIGHEFIIPKDAISKTKERGRSFFTHIPNIFVSVFVISTVVFAIFLFRNKQIKQK